MEDFRQQFSRDSAKTLEELKKKNSAAKNFSDSERREFLRALHTVKGSAQTFGFAAAGSLAHELENLLSAGQTDRNEENFKIVFSEGIELLAVALRQDDFQLPARFVEKIHRIIPANSPSSTIFDGFTPKKMPPDIVECLSQTEKIAINSALKSGKHIYCFEVGFDTASFAEDLIKCRAALTETCEIIATFPNSKLNSGGRIGFRFVCADSAKKVRLEEIAEKYDATISFDIAPENFTKDLRGVTLQAVAHGRDLAEKLGKTVDFQVSVEEIEVSDERLKLVFEILIHLIRNAVDHGIENTGKVELILKTTKNTVFISVADDGNGINFEKLKIKAIEKKIIAAEETLTEQAMLDLIFQPELSTAPKITEISGRGVGLDAVKTSVEKFGGAIKVKNRSERGAVFEVFLPSSNPNEIL